MLLPPFKFLSPVWNMPIQFVMDVENLMTQKKEIQLDSKGDYLKAIQLNHSQVQTIRDNYIHNKLK